ncbi:Glycine receptor subunit alpha-3 [Blattella germanica]|nr:Glycine receptor subunit alpha-3 [Blattella germanica]
MWRSGKTTISWLLLLLLLLMMICTSCSAEITSLTFNDILPEDPKLYDKMRPPKKDGSPTVVHFHVTVMGLDSIDENAMTYAADIFFAQTWKDDRLRLPENMTSEYRLLEVDWLKNMWRPDSFFKNAKSVTFQTMTVPNHYIWLYKDKTILYMWDPDVPLVVDENIELPQLQLVRNKTDDCSQVYSTGNFTCLEVVFVLKRRLGYYLFHTYIPTCLIVIMSWVSFWIKPEAAPARVTLGVTSLLTLSTQHAKSQAALPPVSYLKAVDAFMSACTVFVFMALMEYCLVNIVLGDSDGPKPPPEPPKPDRIFDLAARENARLLTGQPPVQTQPPPAQRNRARAINIDRFSRVFFPLLFAVLNVTYWVLFAEFL